MSEMTERLVETLKRLPIRDNVNRGGELDELRLREAARQILLAMREPTPEMVQAVRDHVHEIGAGDHGEAWGFMIDAALT